MNSIILNEFKLKSLVLKNRAVVAPMSRVSTAGDGVPDQLMAKYYQGFASGNFAMIITEGTYTDNHFSQAYPNQPGISNNDQVEGWKNIVQHCHAKGAKIFLQLMHAGALSQHLSNTRAPSQVSPLRSMLKGYSHKQGQYPIPQSMNNSEIEQVKEGFIKAALNAQKAGFDGVEIHAANGYLLDQFITDYTNQREDKYGGSLQNRIRISAEIIREVKQVVNEKFIVGVRLSQGKVNDFDYQWRGIEDGKIIFSSVAEAGVSYIHFASEGKGFNHGCLTRDGQSLPKLAKELTNIPVIANGGLHIPEEASRILTDGHADLISLGSGALVNLDWPEKIKKKQRINEIPSDLFKHGVSLR